MNERYTTKFFKRGDIITKTKNWLELIVAVSPFPKQKAISISIPVNKWKRDGIDRSNFDEFERSKIFKIELKFLNDPSNIS